MYIYLRERERGVVPLRGALGALLQGGGVGKVESIVLTADKAFAKGRAHNFFFYRVKGN